MASSNRTTVYLLGILTTIMVGWVLHVGAGILQPLVIALLLATTLRPVVLALARYRIPPAATVVLLVILLFFGLAQFGIVLQENLTEFVTGAEASSPDTPAVEPSELAEAEQQLGGWDGTRQKFVARLRDSALPEDVVDLIDDGLADLDVRGLAAGLFGGGVGFTKSLVLVMLYMIFIFAEQAVFRRKILHVVGDDRRDDTKLVIDHIVRGIQRYLGVKTVVSLLTGSLCFLVLRALDVPFALLFGILTFLLNYIPTFGSIIAAVFPTFTALATPEATWVTAVLVLGAYLTINFTLGNMIEPRILGHELDISPLVIIVSVVVWGGLWGVVGAFLAVPLTSAAQIILASYERTRPVAIMLSGGPPKPRGSRRGASK